MINLQFEFVQFYISSYKGLDFTKENLNQIELENLTDNDCICFTIEKDIQRIIYTHTVESTQGVNLEFNFAEIQQAIDVSILDDKPVIRPHVNLKLNIFNF